MAAGWPTDLAAAWGCWAPTLAPDGSRIAFISDRRGRPEVWVQQVPESGAEPAATVLPFCEDPVVAVHFSADGQWLACSVATDGGVRTQIWVLRPDGTGARHVAGDRDQHAILGPWTRHGHRFIVTIAPSTPEELSRCDLVDPETGEHEPVARGYLVAVLDVSADEQFALLRDGKRGAHFCRTLDRVRDADHPLLPYPGAGSTESGLLRPSPAVGLVAYLVGDAGRPRSELVAVPLHTDGTRGDVGTIAAREDAELEFIDADDAGRVLSLVWNQAGRSILELLRPTTGSRRTVPGLPGEVVASCVLARDGASLVVGVESPAAPPRIWRLDLAELSWRPLTATPQPPRGLVTPTLQSFTAHDGLPLTGWLYRAEGVDDGAPGPVAISLHGGPEAQERPVFSPNHQALVLAGISVFAPNVRGSSGFGRAFAHADDRYGRHDAIADVRSCADFLIESGVADPARIAVSGRSYGGYLTLAALTHYPDVFAAGVDICGMSDLQTFYRDTEPWIAAAAVTKYGDPEHDSTLLRDISPIHHADRIRVPVLVIHGEHDTNVPLSQATDFVAVMRALGKPVEYLELAGEGHDYRQRAARALLMQRMTRFLGQHLAAPTGPPAAATEPSGSARPATR